MTKRSVARTHFIRTFMHINTEICHEEIANKENL